MTILLLAMVLASRLVIVYTVPFFGYVVWKLFCLWDWQMQIRFWAPVMIFLLWIPILYYFFSNMHLKRQRNCILVQISLSKLLICLTEGIGWYVTFKFHANCQCYLYLWFEVAFLCEVITSDKTQIQLTLLELLNSGDYKNIKYFKH